MSLSVRRFFDARENIVQRLHLATDPVPPLTRVDSSRLLMFVATRATLAFTISTRRAVWRVTEPDHGS